MHLLLIPYWVRVLQAIFSGHFESYLMHNKGPPFIDILVSSWFIILPLSYKKDGYIMSSSRGSSGETTWSICSRLTFEAQLKSNSLKCLFDASEDIDNFDGRPGSTLGPDDQCRVFLKVEWPEFLLLIWRGTSMKWPEFKLRIHIIFFWQRFDFEKIGQHRFEFLIMDFWKILVTLFLRHIPLRP